MSSPFLSLAPFRPMIGVRSWCILLTIVFQSGTLVVTTVGCFDTGHNIIPCLAVIIPVPCMYHLINILFSFVVITLGLCPVHPRLTCLSLPTVAAMTLWTIPFSHVHFLSPYHYHCWNITFAISPPGSTFSNVESQSLCSDHRVGRKGRKDRLLISPYSPHTM